MDDWTRGFPMWLPAASIRVPRAGLINHPNPLPKTKRWSPQTVERWKKERIFPSKKVPMTYRPSTGVQNQKVNSSKPQPYDLRFASDAITSKQMNECIIVCNSTHHGSSNSSRDSNGNSNPIKSCDIKPHSIASSEILSFCCNRPND